MANIQRFIDMPDTEFDQCVIQAMKLRRIEPAKWGMFLEPELIDATEAAIKAAQGHAEEQAQDPDRFPYARSFALKAKGVLAEITIHRAYVEEA